MTSPDGITWTSRTSAADNGWQSVIYGNGLFVAVASTGTGNLVMTSPDGITWTTRLTVAGEMFLSSANNNQTVVAIGSNWTIARSIDGGITWTTQTDNLLTGNLQQITFGNGLFLIRSNTAYITSPDGITWTLRETGSTTINGIFFVNDSITSNTFLMSRGSFLRTSTDGINWTDTPANGVLIGYLQFFNNQYYSAPESSSFEILRISNNLTTGWTKYSSSTLSPNEKVIKLSNILLMITSSSASSFFNEQNTILRSTNGLTFNTVSAPASSFDDGIVYNNQFFLVEANTFANPRVYRSTNGINWTLSTFAGPQIRRKIIASSNLLVVENTDESTQYSTSPDGINWTLRTKPIQTKMSCANNIFFLPSTTVGQYRTSTDGINWTLRDGGANLSIFSNSDFFFMNGLYFTLTFSGICFSSDPFSTNWQILPFPLTVSSFNSSVVIENTFFVSVFTSLSTFTFRTNNFRDWRLVESDYPIQITSGVKYNNFLIATTGTSNYAISPSIAFNRSY